MSVRLYNRTGGDRGCVELRVGWGSGPEICSSTRTAGATMLASELNRQ